MTIMRQHAVFMLAIALFVMLVGLSWIGFIGSDDVVYAKGAYGWLEHFPYVGGHGSIRYTITLPIAAAFATLGGNEFALVLPSLVYTIGVLIVATMLLRRADGDGSALATLILFATAPLFVIQGSIANVDMVELFFVLGSFALWWRGVHSASPFLLIAAGAFAGLGFLTRETAIFIAPFYGLLFLAGYAMPRARYLWVAAGFFAIWVLELLYLGIMTGDPLYRVNISMHHDSTIDRTIDLAGNVIVHPLIDPLLVLLVNQEFMLLYWAALPFAAWLMLGRAISPDRRRLARLIALFGLVWFLCAAALQSLLPLNPRYFAATTAAAIMLTGLGIAELGRQRHSLAMTLVFALVIGNLIGIAVEDKHPMYAERALARFAQTHPNVSVTTDSMTRHRAKLLLLWAGALDRVRVDVPRAGTLHYYNPAYAARANSRMPDHLVPLFQPRPDWLPLARVRRPMPDAATLVEGLGARRLIPQRWWCVLRRCGPGATFYLVGGVKPRPSTIAANRLSAVPHVAAPSISALSLFAQSAPVDGRKGHRL